MTDFVKAQGPRLLGTRVRRLSEAIDRAVSEIYRELDMPFEPRWAALVNLLARVESTTVTEAAAQLGQSHVAVVQVVNSLVGEGLLESSVDPADRRRRNLRLTASGRRLVRRLEPIWRAIALESESLVSKEAPRLFEQIELLERAFERRPLADRFRARLKSRNRHSDSGGQV